MDTKFLFIPATVLALLLAVTESSAQSPSSAKPSLPKKNTVARPLTPKQIKAREAALKRELETPYKAWINDDVVYIISDDERKAFNQLNTNEEREQFVEQFWLRRDPIPDTEENEFKEEHYRRIAYANEHYASGIAGWRTVRGRIYIQFGPADQIEAHSPGGTYEHRVSEGGGETSTFSLEQWRYRYIEGVGQNIVIEFVDTTQSGEYQMTMDPSEKDALLNVTNAGLTLYEQQGMSTRTDRFNGGSSNRLGVPNQYRNQSMNEFTRAESITKLQQPPPVKFRDQMAAVSTPITYNRLRMLVRYDFVRLTDTSVLVNITMQFDNHDLQFTQKNGIEKASINVFGRVISLTRRPIAIFEPTLEVDAPPDMLQSYVNQRQIYQHSVALPPGRYHLNVVAKDIASGNTNVYEQAVDVPHFSEERLASSTLILADTLEKLPVRSIEGAMFAIGDTKVRPRVDDTFKTDENMGVYVQFYNFAPGEKTNIPDGSIRYVVSKVGSTASLFDVTEDLSSVQYAAANQVTVQKLLPLKTLGPGVYKLTVKATDRRANQTVQQQSGFIVN